VIAAGVGGEQEEGAGEPGASPATHGDSVDDPLPLVTGVHGGGQRPEGAGEDG
jgi:hypothetical protein